MLWEEEYCDEDGTASSLNYHVLSFEMDPLTLVRVMVYELDVVFSCEFLCFLSCAEFSMFQRKEINTILREERNLVELFHRTSPVIPGATIACGLNAVAERERSL